MAIEHQPPDTLSLDPSERLYFLAGLIQGAPDWQAEAFNALDDIAPKRTIHVANPRREYIGIRFDYDKQVEWEERNLLRASRNGGILFWLAAQDPDLPYEVGRAYGQTTRFEFGEAIGWMRYDPAINIALGIEVGYVGNERYYRKKAASFNINVNTTLERTVDALMKVPIRNTI